MQASELKRAFEAYKSLDPSGWVALYRVIPVYAGLALCIVGAVLLAAGSNRAVRLLTAPLGGLVGYLAIPPLLSMLQLSALPQDLTWAPAAGLALLGLLYPPGVFFVAVGVPVGLVTAELLGRSDFLIGLGVGLFVSGGAAMLLWRRLSALLSAAAGAWLFVLGLLSTFHAFLPFLGNLAQSAPLGMLGVAGVLALVGAAYQLAHPTTGKKRAEGRTLDRRLPPGGGRA